MPKGFQKNHEKFEGEGRPLGSKAKNTMLRELVRDFALDKFEKYLAAFDKISEPKDKCKEYREMLNFVLPKISSLQFETSDEASTAAQHLKNLASWASNSTSTLDPPSPPEPTA